MSSPLSLKRSAKLSSYEDLSLKVYFEIIKTGNCRLLLLEGDATDKQCRKAWEDIVRRNEKSQGTLWYFQHYEDLDFLKQVVGEYVLVSAMLNKLLYVIDWKAIHELQRMGYNLDTTSNKAFERTLRERLQNVKNLITQFKMKRADMERDNKANKDEAPTFETTMARLSVAIGFPVPENITLIRFNEFNKILRERNAKNKKPVSDE